MADKDNYRGYGSPSGRYYEAREYEQGYDRDRNRDRDDRGLFGGRDRDDDRYRTTGRDYGDWRSSGDRDRYRGGRDDDRGFFERAGEQVRSWFNDDDDDRGRDRVHYREHRNNDREDMRGQSRYQNQDRNRGYGLGGMMSGRGGFDQDRDDRSPQTFGNEPTSGGYDYGRDEWRSGGQYSTGRFGSGGMARGGSRSYRGDNERNQGGRFQGSHPNDEHYYEWRNQQMSALDRDYDEYRRENRDKFHNEFSSWRGNREQQRSSMRQVREHMEVVGSDGEHVGTVDKIAGDRIILTKNDPAAGGHHHSIPCAWLQSVDDKVTINKTAEQAKQQWTDEENRRALFESDDQPSDDGPHMLNRSFSGTYEGR